MSSKKSPCGGALSSRKFPNFRSVGLAVSLAAGCIHSSFALPGQPLKELAAPYGLEIGSITTNGFWDSNQVPTSNQYRDIIREQFSVMTAENEVKFSSIRPNRNTFDFSKADEHHNFTYDNGMKVHGHTLIWHLDNPQWLFDVINNWNGSEQGLRNEMIDIMYEHIDVVAGRYAGEVYFWDVVNEVIPDNPSSEGTRRGENENTYSPWYSAIGPDYIELALQRTRQADPNTKLIINDYIQAQKNIKSDLYYELVKDFQARNIPLDGLGFQMHLKVVDGQLQNKLGQPFDMDSFSENLMRFSDLGIDLFITELDIAMPYPYDDSKRELQAQFYDEILNRALQVPNLVSFQTWGFTDLYSWVESDPELPNHCCAVLLDRQYDAKPSYTALQNRLLNGVTAVQAIKTFEAEQYEDSFGWNSVFTDFISMGSATSDDWLKYSNVDLSNGYTTFSMRYARPHTGPIKVEVRLDNENGQLIGTLDLQNTGGTENYEVHSTNLNITTSGTRDVYFRLVGGTESAEGNFDYFRLGGGTWNNNSGDFSNDISNVSAPTSYVRGQSYNVSVDYETDATRDILVSLEDTSNGFTWYASARATVNPGAGTVDFTLNVDSNAPVSSNYQLQTILTDVGGYYGANVDSFPINPVSVTNQTLSNNINSISGPSTLNPGQTYTVTVDYEAAGTRDIFVSLEDISNGWNYEGTARQTVNAGSGSIDLSLTVDADAPTGSNYQLQAINAEVGGYWGSHDDNKANAVTVTNNGGQTDAINSVNGPNSVVPGESYTISVNYESAGNRDVLVTIEDTANGYAWYGNVRQTVGSGSGTLNLTLSVDANAPAGGAYQIQTILTTVGGYWGSHFANQAINPVTVGASGTNYVTNGGFENGLSDWNGSTWSTSTDSYEGNNSANINGEWYVWLDQNVADAWNSATHDIADFRGKNVTLRFHAKQSGGGNGIRVGMQNFNDVQVTGGSWTEYTVNAFIPNDTNSLKVFIEPQGGNCFVDNVRLTID